MYDSPWLQGRLTKWHYTLNVRHNDTYAANLTYNDELEKLILTGLFCI
jgi:hypothetical protein